MIAAMTPDRLRFRRRELGLTTRELSLALEFSEKLVQRVEDGVADEREIKVFERALNAFEERLLLASARP
jgi:predicted transcriptional regulator